MHYTRLVEANDSMSKQNERNEQINKQTTKPLKWPQDFLNIKCVIFTLYIALIYWFIFGCKLASKNTLYYIGFALANYLLINWYNYSYECFHNNMAMNGGLASLISLVFYFLPKNNWVVLAFLLYIPYFLLAWYDYFANCKFRMNPTLFPFGRFIFLPMKPDPYKRRFDELDPYVVQNIANFDKYVGVAIGVAAIIFTLKKYVL